MRPYIQTPCKSISEQIQNPIDKNGKSKIIFEYDYTGEYDGEYDDYKSYTAPIYAMLQATGYKHTSNKELPAEKISWLRYYFPAHGGTVNALQKYSFYIKWTCTDDSIIGYPYKISNIFGGTKSKYYTIKLDDNGEPIKDELGKYVVIESTGTREMSTGKYNINTDNVTYISEIDFFNGNGDYGYTKDGDSIEYYAGPNESDLQDHDKIIIKF